MIEAAGALFIERGYAGATLADVAEHARVSLATVKLVARTKPDLLLQVVYARARGDADPVPITERPAWARMIEERDPEALLERWVAISCEAHQRQAAILEVVRQAASVDPEVAKMARRGANSRRDDYAAVVGELRSRRALSRGIKESTAIDIAWALNSPELFRLFARQGWTPDRWQSWLLNILKTQLLGESLTAPARK